MSSGRVKKIFQKGSLLGLALAALSAVGLLLIYLLAQTTSNQQRYEENYTVLLTINIVVSTLLFFSITWAVRRLYKRLKQGKFGSQLLIKLALVFALVGVIPGVLVYLVSYQFVSRSIETWFDVRIESALDSGVSLARNVLDGASQEQLHKTQEAAKRLENLSLEQISQQLASVRQELALSNLTVWGEGKKVLASAGNMQSILAASPPEKAQLQQIKKLGYVTTLEGLDDTAAVTAKIGTRAQIKTVVKINETSYALSEQTLYLQSVYELDSNLAKNALTVQNAFSEYQERSLAREGLRRMYIGTLSLTLFLAVFMAVFMAFLLGRQLAQPLLLLADGVQQVAAGDLSPKKILENKDELGGLTRSFALMTQQLAEARDSANLSLHLLDEAHGHVQTILDNLTTGVVLLDKAWRILSYNPSAARILRTSGEMTPGSKLSELTDTKLFGALIEQHFEDWHHDSLEPDGQNLKFWEKSFEIPMQSLASTTPEPVQTRPSHLERAEISIIARGAQIAENEFLLVFDDISDVVTAQRTQAWAEVAKRLAHEIKNPLTPIQLSAERIGQKLHDKVATTEQAFLAKSVKTIVDQVEAMKRLVNEFRDFGRLPSVELRPVNLNELILETLQLYVNSEVPIRCELEPNLPKIMADRQQMMQIIHNLLQNSQDACEKQETSEIIIRTRSTEDMKRVRLSIIDNGTGFSENLLRHAFEPYVTTKAKGTGLGLAVVKKITDEHHARIEVTNITDANCILGARVAITFKVAV